MIITFGNIKVKAGILMKKMMKILLKFICLLIVVLFVFTMLPRIKYSFKEVGIITYSRGRGMDGRITEYKIDFSHNKVYRKDTNVYFPPPEEAPEDLLESEDYKNNGVYLEIAAFTEEQEEKFLRSCRLKGLFMIREIYRPIFPMNNGSGRELNVRYYDGSVKRSEGWNESPDMVFNMCSVDFYDLCGERVLGKPPKSYNEKQSPKRKIPLDK